MAPAQLRTPPHDGQTKPFGQRAAVTDAAHAASSGHQAERRCSAAKALLKLKKGSRERGKSVLAAFGVAWIQGSFYHAGAPHATTSCGSGCSGISLPPLMKRCA